MGFSSMICNQRTDNISRVSVYTLYCYPGSRATAAHMVLAEGSLPHRLELVDFVHDEHRSPRFLAINPRGTIPALVGDDGVVVCETIAIMLYLSEKHGLALTPEVTDPMRGVMLDWLVYHAVEVQEPMKRSFFAHRHADNPTDEEIVRERANALFNQRWQLVEAHLRKNGPFHLGERFSIVDIYMLVTGAYSHPCAQGDFPAIEECLRRSEQRPAITSIYAEHKAGLEYITNVGVPR